MARLPVNTIGNIEEDFAGDQVKLVKIDAPFTTVVNRAQTVDLSKDGKPRLGTQRIITHDLIRIDDEQGPSGELVYKALNDRFEQMRFVGEWVPANNVFGTYLSQAVANPGFVEITFYGTGLNVLIYQDTTNRGFEVFVDTVSQGSITTGGIDDTIILARNYQGYSAVNIVSGLSLGTHTIRLLSNGAANSIYYGFDILNERSDVLIPEFTRSNNMAYPATQLAYNSGFESGTLGTKGGCVSVYAKADGTTAHAVTPTEASTLTMSATDHSNEEIITSYFWREFGTGRADDYGRAL